MVDAEQIYRKASTLDAARLQTLADFLDFLLTRDSAKSDGSAFTSTAFDSADASSLYRGPAQTLGVPKDADDRETVERAARRLPVTEVGRTLRAIRERAIGKGMPLQSVDAILAEVHEGRAEAGDDQDLH